MQILRIADTLLIWYIKLVKFYKDNPMYMIAYLLSTVINLYILVIIAQVAVSWLINFGVINIENKQAQNLVALLKKLTEPVYAPIRKYIPPIGGIDLTPLIVIIGLQIIDHFLVWRLFYGAVYY